MDQVRERFARYGPGSLSDAEVLGLALGVPITTAEALLDGRDGLRGVTALEHPDAAYHRGIGPRRALALQAIAELARRLTATRMDRGEPFRSAAQVAGYFRPRLAHQEVEVFAVLLLDTRHRKIRDVEISRGSLSASIVHPRETFRAAVREAAAAILAIHNHPSSDVTPSPEDVELTRRLRQAGETLGIKLLDHIIIGADSHFSFVESGWW